MKFCPNCGNQMEDSVTVCNKCNTAMSAPQAAPMQAQMPQQMPPQQVMNVAPVAPGVPADFDHTADFDAQEISDGKVFGLAIYLIPFFGVLCALLGASGNKYVAFHVRTWLKLAVMSMLSYIVCIIPFLGWIVAGIWGCITFVLTIICFINVCKGKAIDPPIIRNCGFLK